MYVDIQQSAADMTRLRQSLASGGVTAGSTSVRLKLEDGSDYGLPGTVQFSEVTVNEATGTVTLRARFPNPSGLLMPGMFVTALFDQAVNPAAMLVPQGRGCSAISTDRPSSIWSARTIRPNGARSRQTARSARTGSSPAG